MTNPLLAYLFLPPFSKIQSRHILPAVTKILFNCKTKIKYIINKNSMQPTWENLCQPLSEMDAMINRIVSPVSHLNSVKNNPELRKIYEKVLVMLSKYDVWINQNKKIYKAYCNLRNSKYYTVLSIEQKKAVDNTIRDFKLSGIILSKRKKHRYSEIIIRLSKLSNQYSNNVLDATMSWTKLITNKSELSGVPERVLAAARERAKKKGKKGWLLTLDESSYLQILTYCNNRILREEIYRAYNTRASDQGQNPEKWDNSLIMNEILTLRQELAKLLGFKNYAHKSLSTKMAKSPQRVFSFLIDLAERILPQGKREIEQLRTFAKSKYGIEDLCPWDVKKYSEKQKQYLYGINNEQLRSYFPENKVINGLFEIVKRLYGINIKERHNIDVWDPDVRFFDLYDENNELYGSFYLDLYARENKCNGAWMNDHTCRMKKSDGSLQRAVAYLTCNFNRPVNGGTALLTHDEIITLFHEFGHVLHHTLTRVETASVSGINGIPWDAVELPSQLMENWCWEPDVLKFISGHYETGASLPKELLKGIFLSKKYQTAMFILRQLEFGLFDLQLHSEFDPVSNKSILEILAKTKKQISIFSEPEWNRFPHSFSHIFSGNYAAGYYSYLWANILSSDAYSRFKEEGIFNRRTGRSFLNNILACGGCEDPMELFKRFRGREPQIEVALKQYGIEN